MTHNYNVETKWIGSLDGKGTLKSANLESDFTVPKEFGGLGKGTNPEELMALAASTCYAITLSAMCGFQGIKLKSLSMQTSIEVVFDKGLSLKKITHTPTVVAITGTELKITEIINKAKEVCFFSKALKENIEMEIMPQIIMETV